MAKLKEMICALVARERSSRNAVYLQNHNKMTPTEKQKCIAEQAVYGDLQGFLVRSKEMIEITSISKIDVYLGNIGITNIATNIDNIKPILRPLYDLTVEITHKGYNDDKPFLPLVELAKAYHPNCIKYRMSDNDYVVCEYSSHGVDYSFNEYSEKGLNLIKEEFDLLHLWHFDTRGLIEKGDAIDVNTLGINPYEV